MERGFGVVPLGLVLPVGILVLMLHVEEPGAHAGGQERHRQMDQEECLPPDHRHDHQDQRQDRRVVPPDGGTLAVARALVDAEGQPLHDHEVNRRRDHKQEEGVAEDPVRDALEARRGQILVHGHGPNIAVASLAQVGRMRVVESMVAPPIFVGHHGEHATGIAGDVIGAPRFEERSVARIMLNDEDAHQEPRSGDGQQQRQPVTDIAQTQIHEHPHHEEAAERGDQLGDAFADIRLVIGGDKLAPGLGIGDGVTRRCLLHTFCSFIQIEKSGTGQWCHLRRQYARSPPFVLIPQSTRANPPNILQRYDAASKADPIAPA